MIEIGRFNHLNVIKKLEFGYYLDGDDWGEILLPTKFCPPGLKEDDSLDVFLYFDSEDRVIATTKTPKVVVGQCAALKVIDINRAGVFLDWGLEKDLLLPKDEQIHHLEVGDTIVVFIFQDEKSRLVASMKLRDFVSESSAYLKEKQAVELLITNRTELGYRALINQNCLGILYHNEIFQPLKVGDKVDGYIKRIRADEKVDLCLQLPGKDTQQELMDKVVVYLKQEGGCTKLTDKSPPNKIKEELNVSKAAYKRALGRLYKLQKITLSKEKVCLVGE